MFNFIMETLRLERCQTEHPFVNTAFKNYKHNIELCIFKIIGRVRVELESLMIDQTFKVLNLQKVFFIFSSAEIL